MKIVNDVSRPLPYEDGAFDVLVCCEMLEHLPFNTVNLMREIRRVVAPGGFAFIAVPNQASAARRWQLLTGKSTRESIAAWAAAPLSNNWHWREYTEVELRDLLYTAGFKQIETGFRHYQIPHHPNPVRRALVAAMYALAPQLKKDIWAVAS